MLVMSSPFAPNQSLQPTPLAAVLKGGTMKDEVKAKLALVYPPWWASGG
jgi:hypothetical protein